WVRRHTFEIVLISPLVIYVLVLTVAPIIDTFRLSFSAPRAGFGTVKSYDAIFTDGVFRHAVVNTIIVALLSLTLEVGVGFAIADMWKVLPIMTLIFLAGLQSIPEDVYEAADVDGATKWQRFIRVTLPLLIPFFTMALILRAIDAFRIFELALVLGTEPVLG